MADVKISGLPAATTPVAGTEVLPIVQSSTTKKVSIADLTAGRSISTAGGSLDGAVTINDSGADVDFRVEGDTDANLIFGDASTNSVGVGTNTPSEKLDVNGNVAISATAGRIVADFSNATVVNRVAFKSSVTNGETVPYFLPNGTNTTAGVAAANAADPTNAALIRVSVNGTTDARVASDVNGSGGYLPLTFYTNGTQKLKIDANTTGSYTFGGTAPRIIGEMTSGTLSSRLMFQTSATNSTTLVGIIPNGTGVNSGLQCYNSSNPDSGANSIFDVRVIGTTDVRLQATYQGSGTPLPMTFYTGGAKRFELATNGFATFGAAVGRGAPATKTGDFTLLDTENWVICNGTGSITVTLPTASSWAGREIMIKTIAAQTVVSASSNVVPLAGGAAGTDILAATAGKWATLVSDGTNWIIMAGN